MPIISFQKQGLVSLRFMLLDLKIVTVKSVLYFGSHCAIAAPAYMYSVMK